MKIDKDGSWVVLLSLMFMIFIFFLPVIMNVHGDQISPSLQWISAVGGILSPLSAIFVSYYVFIDQKRREKSKENEYIRSGIHDDIKILSELAILSRDIKSIYGSKNTQRQIELDRSVKDRIDSSIKKLDNLRLWSMDNELIKTRIVARNLLTGLSRYVSDRLSQDNNTFYYLNV